MVLVLLFVATSVISSIIYLYTPSSRVQAATNSTINFQARILTNTGALVPDGYYNVEFKLYTASSGGSTVWTETYYDSNGPTAGNDNRIQVKNGYVTANLGTLSTFANTIDWSQELWLSMNIGGVAHTATPTWDGEMAPRMKVTAVPYAFRAAEATQLKTVNGANVSTLSILAPTGGNQVFQIQDQGAGGTYNLCIQNSSACGFALLAGANTFTAANTFSAAGTALSVTNNATIGGTLGVTGLTTATGGLTVGTGTNFINQGSTLFTAQTISDVAGGGNIGTAAATVDAYTVFNVAQTTASQTLTLPTPTNTTAGRMAFVNNTGTASFTMYGSVIASGKSNAFIWNGSAWVTTVSLSGSVVNTIGTLDSQAKSADGASIAANAIYLQTADGTNPGIVSTVAQTFAGAKTFSSLITGQAGLTTSGAAISLNDNSNFNTTINTGTSTGTVAIGSANAGTINVQSGSTIGLTATTSVDVTGTTNINASANNATNINTGTSTGAVTIGNASAGAITLQSGAAINSTAGAASTISTTAGALTITSAAAATWSTTAGNLTLQAGSGTVSLGTSTALTASGALGITSGGANALTLDTGGAAALSVGATNANALSISRAGITTTVNGVLTVAENANFNGNTTIGNATTDRLTVTSQLLGQDALVFQGATDDGFTTTFRVTDPTANNIITFPNSSGTVQLAPTAGSYIKQVPTSTAENTITPTANSVVGLTVNGTSGTAATALAVSQPGAAEGVTIASANNTATNGLSFSGTFTNLINSTNFTVSNSGAITAVGVNSGTGLLQGTGGLTVTGATSINASGANTTNIGTGTNTGVINIGNASAGALALQSGAGVTVTGGAASSFTTTSGNLTFDSAAVLNLGNTSATSITLGRTGVTTTNAGALTVSQLLTGSLGATISGAAISLNDNSNFNTTINTGTSTGTVAIGSANAGNISLQSGGTISLIGTTNINTTGTANTAIGNATGTFALTSNGGLSVSTGGALTGVSGITTTGAYTQSGTSANTLTGATTLSNTLTVQTTTATQDQIIVQAAAVGAARFAGTITNADLTAARTYTLPNASGTFTLNPTSGSYLQTIPTTTAANTVAPTTASVVGLTVNGTTNATGATALIVNQSNTTATGAAFNLTNASGVQTDGVLINRSTAGGTTTNLLNLTNTAGTATNGLTFSGTFTNLINSTNFTVSNAGAITAVGVNSGTGLLQGTGGLTVTGATSINASGATATSIGTGTNTGLVTIGNASNAANTVTLVAGSTNGINLNAPKVESNATTLGLFTTPTTVNSFTAATALNIGAATGIATFGNGGAYTLRSTTGQLTVQSGSGTLSFGSTTALTASGALGITSGGANALTLDTGGAATLSVGATNANALSISRAGITTTVNGVLTVVENANFNGNTTIGDATTDRLTVTSQLLGQDALVFQGATDDGFTTTLRVTNPTANNILTLPNETGTICTTGSVCTGYAPSATNGYVQLAPASAQADATNNSSIFINKTSGTGNILQLQRAGSDALVVANNGYVGLGGSASNRLSVTDTQAANSGYVAAQNISQTFTPTTANYSTWAMGMNVTTSLGASTAVDSSNVNANIRGIYAEAANFSGQSIYASYGVTGASGIGSGAGGAITNAYGAQGYVYQNGAGTITNAFPVFSEVRSTGAGQIINATGFYGDLSVTAGTVGEYTLLKAADYSSIVGANQFGVITYGKSRFGDNTLPTEVLEVAGNISVTAANSYKIGGVIAVEASGGYLRLNQNNQFAQGIYTGTSGVRVGGTTGILVGSIGADGQIGLIPNGVDTTRRITLDGGTGAITAIGINSGTGLIQGTGGVTVTGTTNINATGTAAATIGNGTGTLALLGGNSSSWIVGTGGNTTTLNFTAPSGANTITFPAASGIVQVSPSGSGNSLVQVPTSNTAGVNGANVISPTADWINGLTINGTTAATNKADALVVNQSGTGVNAATIRLQAAGALAGAEIKLENASGTTTAGLLVNRNTAGGTTTAGVNITNGAGTMTTGLNIQNSGTMTNGIQLAGAGTLTSAINLNSNATNGIIFNGTITTDITTATGRNLNIITATTGQLNLDTGTTGAINIGTNANAKTVTIGNTTGASIVNIQGGTGTAAGDINIGDTTVAGKIIDIGSVTNAATSTIRIATAAAVQTVTVGSTNSTSTTTIQAGANGANTTLALQAASGGVITMGSQTAANTINVGTVGSAAFSSTVNVGTSTGAAQTVNIGSTNGASSLNLNAGTGRINLNASTLQFVAGANRTINVASAATPNTLTVAAGSATGANTNGAALYLQGGSATSGNASGGNVFVQGGTGIGTGAKGLVVLDTATYLTAATQSSAVDVNITQANIDSYGAIVLNATAADVNFTLSAPTLGASAAGRLVYVTAANGSNDFTLRANVGGGVGVEQNIAMRQNTTATMIWNGSQWTAAGASSSTTLQAAYDNTLSSAGGAEIILSNSATANGLTVRNNANNPIIGGIFEAQTSIGSNLFSVNNNATEYATNGGAETIGATASTFPANTWDATTGGIVDRYTTVGDNIATGAASVRVQASGSNHGARNRISAPLTSGLTYSVSFAVRGATNFNTLDIRYSPDGSTSGTTQCSTAEVVTSGIWTRINCTFVASGAINANNSILIRQTDATARTFYIDNLSVNINASATYAADGSVDNAGTFATNWTAYGVGSTANRDTSVIYDSSASARGDTINAADRGIRNNLAIVPSVNTQYLVSFYARSGTGNINDLTVRYSRDGGTNFVSCVDYSTQAIDTTGWTKITCLFTTDGTAASNADLIITQASAPGGTRSIYVDALSMTLNTNNANNVQIGGANKGGPTTLFTLDRSDSPPIAANNDAYLGSMYYDTTTGRIQCYEADGWGACGSAPDNIVNLNPEYSGAVLNGSGVGTMTADLCADQAGVLQVNQALCDGTGNPAVKATNFYKWTSPQATQQTYSIYVSYQLPTTFKGFASDDTVQLTARVDNTTNAAVTYEMFRSEGGTLYRCGTGETAVTTSANTWQTVGINGNEATGCGFTSSSGGAYVIFKVNVKANSNANAYVSTLSFTTTGK